MGIDVCFPVGGKRQVCECWGACANFTCPSHSYANPPVKIVSVVTASRYLCGLSGYGRVFPCVDVRAKRVCGDVLTLPGRFTRRLPHPSKLRVLPMCRFLC